LSLYLDSTRLDVVRDLVCRNLSLLTYFPPQNRSIFLPSLRRSFSMRPLLQKSIREKPPPPAFWNHVQHVFSFEHFPQWLCRTDFPCKVNLLFCPPVPRAAILLPSNFHSSHARTPFPLSLTSFAAPAPVWLDYSSYERAIHDSMTCFAVVHFLLLPHLPRCFDLSLHSA